MKRPLEVINAHKINREAQPNHPEVCNEFHCHLALLSARDRDQGRGSKYMCKGCCVLKYDKRAGPPFMLKEQRMYVPCPLSLQKRGVILIVLIVSDFHPVT